jgi:glycosyltransferase involved in cell wall biosynthesis
LKAKKNILVFVDWFYPGFLAGGPVQSIVSIVEHLHEEFQFWIFTSNRDLNSVEPYTEITSNAWVDSPLGCKVYYADSANLSKKLVSDVLSSQTWDKVYINSLFSKYYSIVPLLLLKRKFKHLPVIVAPRGMFGSGALSIKKYKKKGFLFYAKHSGLHKRVIWHAASSREASEIHKALGKDVTLHTVSNLPKRLNPKTKSRKEKKHLKLFFSSRISPIKNVLFAIEVLSLIKTQKIQFNLYGLIENESYWNQCKQRIVELPKNIIVEHRGTYSSAEALHVFEEEDALFLPTRNENYGHSIVESLSCGCPAIISDQTPWKDLQDYGAGYALPLSDKAAFVQAIERLAEMNEEEFSKMRNQAILYIERKINIDHIIQQYTALFHE